MCGCHKRSSISEKFGEKCGKLGGEFGGGRPRSIRRRNCQDTCAETRYLSFIANAWTMPFQLAQASLNLFGLRCASWNSGAVYCRLLLPSAGHPVRRSDRFPPPWTRGAKIKSTFRLRDLPQGTLKLEPYNDGADETPRYPTVVQGHRNHMQKFKNCVVLTRVGSFYEVSLLLPYSQRIKVNDKS
jgi:hypothetical protein